MKYKQLSYYTQNFQQPLLYPILEIKEYLPSFSRFKTKNLFQHDLDETINYDFNFKENVLTTIINKNHPLKKEEDKINCCLVKKFYHVKGKIIIKKRRIIIMNL